MKMKSFSLILLVVINLFSLNNHLSCGELSNIITSDQYDSWGAMLTALDAKLDAGVIEQAEVNKNSVIIEFLDQYISKQREHYLSGQYAEQDNDSLTQENSSGTFKKLVQNHKTMINSPASVKTTYVKLNITPLKICINSFLWDFGKILIRNGANDATLTKEQLSLFHDTELAPLQQSLIQVKTKLHNLSEGLTTLSTQQEETTKLDKWILPQKPDLNEEYVKTYIIDQLKKEDHILDLADPIVSDMAAINPKVLPTLVFKTATNLNEETFFQDLQKEPKKYIKVLEKDDKKYFKLTDDTNKKKYYCGRFELLSIGELRDKTSDYNAINPDSHPGKISVRDALVDDSKLGDTTLEPWRKWKVDIGALQAHPDFFNAVFQVSSNFNGLETIRGINSLSKLTINNYYKERSQGPAASLSAIYGAILRLYFPFYDKDKEPKEWRQTDTNYVNFLQTLQKENKVSVSPSGYATILTTEQPTEEDLKKVKIGFHEDVQVFYGARSGNTFITLKDKPTQIINQVFTSALDFRSSSNKHSLTEAAHEAWGKMLIAAAYEGTLRAAAMHGKKKVVLTLVGAGIFANPKQWIVDALKGMQYFIQKAGLDVTIIGYGENDLKGIRDQLAQLVEDTNGTYLPESRYPHLALLRKYVDKISSNYKYPNFKTLENSKYLVRRFNFFNNVVGRSEAQFVKEFPGKFIRYDEKSGLFYIKNQITDIEYQCGRFDLYPLWFLRKYTKNFKKLNPNNINGKFHAFDGSRDDKQNSEMVDWARKWKVDIGANQANPEYSDAVFQVASNYNGLEFVSSGDQLSEHRLSKYINDRTQGPFASISAAPGTILRMYFPYYDTKTNPEKWKQTANRYVNMLKSLCKPKGPLDMKQAGYVKLPTTGDNPTYKVNGDSFDQITIGFQEQVQVTHGALKFPNKHLKLPDDHIQIINQVFTAAPNFVGDNQKGTTQIAWAKAILKAAYEGTIRVAALKGKKKLILTLVGGGVFENEKQWIFDAIANMKDFVVQSGLEVTIIGFADQNDPKWDFNGIDAQIKKLCHETGGNYYDKNNNIIPPQHTS